MAKSTNLAKPTEGPNMDVLRSFGLGALEDISASDIIMPRYKLVQSTSRTGTPGKWVSNVSDVEYDSLDVVILGISTYRIYFPEAGGGDKPLCRSNDGIIKADGNGVGDGKCKNCRYNVWTKDKQDNSVPPKCREGYSLLVLVLQEDGTFAPGMISIKGAARRPAKQFFTRMKARGVTPLSYITRVTSVSEVNNKGRFFRANLDFGDNEGWLPLDLVAELAEQAKNYMHYVGTDAMIDDDRDMGDTPTPTATGGQDFLNSLNQVGGAGPDSGEDSLLFQ